MFVAGKLFGRDAQIQNAEFFQQFRFFRHRQRFPILISRENTAPSYSGMPLVSKICGNPSNEPSVSKCISTMTSRFFNAARFRRRYQMRTNFAYNAPDITFLQIFQYPPHLFGKFCVLLRVFLRSSSACDSASLRSSSRFLRSFFFAFFFFGESFFFFAFFCVSSSSRFFFFFAATFFLPRVFLRASSSSFLRFSSSRRNEISAGVFRLHRLRFPVPAAAFFRVPDSAAFFRIRMSAMAAAN